MLGLDPASRRPRDPRPARRRAAARHARQRAHRPREPDHLRPLLRDLPRRVARAGRRAARVRPALRARGRHGRAAVGRDEAPADDRALARERPRADAARRADHRPRPAGAARGLGAAVPAEAPGRDARAHDALHGRGRAVLRPARDHGPRAASPRRARRSTSSGALSTREVVELRFPADVPAVGPEVFDGQVARIEALPDRAPALHRRRRRARPACARAAPPVERRSSGAARSRTSSSGSPAARFVD